MTKRKISIRITIIIIITIMICTITINVYSVAKERDREITYDETIDVHRYYYNQLTQGEKQIYKQIEASKQRILANQKIQLAKLDLQNEKVNYHILSKIVGKIILAYRMDNPVATLWLNHYSAYIEDASKIMIKPKNGSYYDFKSWEDLQNAMEEVEQKAKGFVQSISGTREEKLKKIHNWLLEDLEYDETTKELNIANVYGCIINKKSVCSGFAYSLKYIADIVQIPVIIEAGATHPNKQDKIEHMWNVVFIDKWYRIDMTANINFSSKDKYFKFLLEDSNYYPTLMFKSP